MPCLLALELSHKHLLVVGLSCRYQGEQYYEERQVSPSADVPLSQAIISLLTRQDHPLRSHEQFVILRHDWLIEIDHIDHEPLEYEVYDAGDVVGCWCSRYLHREH